MKRVHSDFSILADKLAKDIEGKVTVRPNPLVEQTQTKDAVQ
jgi:hypothetical protein